MHVTFAIVGSCVRLFTSEFLLRFDLHLLFFLLLDHFQTCKVFALEFIQFTENNKIDAYVRVHK